MIQFDEHIFQMGWFNHQQEQFEPRTPRGHHGPAKVDLEKAKDERHYSHQSGDAWDAGRVLKKTDAPWELEYLLQRIHGNWYIYLHLVDLYGKCR